MNQKTKLKWLKFKTWKEAIDDEDGGCQFPCVYVVAEPNGKPLYVGKTTQKGNETYSGGLRARYYHDWTVLDACMEGTGRLIFVAEVDPDDAGDIERQLIYENPPKYNKNGKANSLDVTYELLHEGTPPKFST